MMRVLFGILFFMVMGFCGFSQGVQRILIPENDMRLETDGVKMIPFRNGDLYGFVKPNNPSEFIIQPIYKSVLSVSAHGAIVNDGSGYGMVNEFGEVLIPCEFDYLSKTDNLYHGWVVSDQNDLQYENSFYDVDGALLYQQKSNNRVEYGRNNYAWFDRGDSLLVIDRQGLITSKFLNNKREFCLGFHNDLLCFKKKRNDVNYYQAFTHDGKMVFEIPTKTSWYKGVIQLGADFFMFESSPNNRTFANSYGEFKPYRARFSSYELNQDADAMTAAICVGDVNAGVMGVIKSNADTIIPFVYDRIYTNVNGFHLAVEKESQRLVVLTNQGEFVSEIDDSLMDFMQQRYVLKEPVGFYEGLAIGRVSTINQVPNIAVHSDSTTKEAYFVFFNTKGDRVIQLDPKYTYVGNFHEGLAAVADSENKLGFIDKEGSWVIEPSFKFDPTIDSPNFCGGFVFLRSENGYVDRNGRRYYKD